MKVYKKAVQAAMLQNIDAMRTFLDNPAQLELVCHVASEMAALLQAGKKLMACGNGGSACQAMHFAEELSGRYRDDRRALAALSLTDASHITCVGNDYGFAQIFARAVAAYGHAGDGLLLLSTSGHSPNLLAAAECARTMKVKTFALLGKGGGQLKGRCDYEVLVPGLTSDTVQNIHMVLIHNLIELIERQLFPENYQAKEAELMS